MDYKRKIKYNPKLLKNVINFTVELKKEGLIFFQNEEDCSDKARMFFCMLDMAIESINIRLKNFDKNNPEVKS